MKPILIAEIGLCHNGSIETAREMIRIAKECGATMVKGQAFKSKDVKGSMPQAFYDEREIGLMDLIQLIQYGEEIGIPVFFSIFSKEYIGLKSFQKWHKFAASQSKKSPKLVEQSDNYNTIVSVNLCTLLPWLKKSPIMYACPYLTENPGLEAIDFLTEFYGRQVGYSDHTVGVDWCIQAALEHKAPFIEKHFTLTRDIYFEGKQFRDCVHGALPSEFERLANRTVV